MSTISEKLQQLNNIKNDFKEKINAKGGSITDTTPFSEYPSQVENLSGGGGGGIIEVDKLPYSTWKGTAVPRSSYVEKVYFNSKLTNEQVDEICSVLPEGRNYLYGSTNNPYVRWVQLYKYSGKVDSIDVYNTQVYSTTTSNSKLYSDPGWIIENGVFEINSDNQREYNGAQVGQYNELLTSLFSTTPFEEEPQGAVDGMLYKANDNLYEYHKNPIEVNTLVNTSYYYPPQTSGEHKVYINTAFFKNKNTFGELFNQMDPSFNEPHYTFNDGNGMGWVLVGNGWSENNYDKILILEANFPFITLKFWNGSDYTIMFEINFTLPESQFTFNEPFTELPSYELTFTKVDDGYTWSQNSMFNEVIYSATPFKYATRQWVKYTKEGN